MDAELPISQVVLAVSQSASFVFSNALVVVRGLSISVAKLISLALVLSPIPVVRYVLAPVFIFVHLAFSVFILLPYKLAVNLVDVLYPLYVFFGVACIAGALVGLGGRALAAVITAFILRVDHDAEDSPTSDGKRTVAA